MEKEKKFEEVEKGCQFKGRYPAEKRCIKTENLQRQKVGSCSLEFCPELMPAKPEGEENVDTPEEKKLEGDSTEVEEKKEEVSSGKEKAGVESREVESVQGEGGNKESDSGEKKEEEKEDPVGRTKTPVETVMDFQSKNKIVTNQTESEK